MNKEIDLFESNECFETISYNDREEWLIGRKETIGGSESSTMIGMNEWKTASRLWKEKKGIITPDVVKNSAISHGIALEPIIREWFKATYNNYQMQYKENTILYSKKYEWMSYSPDGLLLKTEENVDVKKGIWECKTSLINNKESLEKWNNQLPQSYYIQVLHGLLVTGYDFVNLTAELTICWNNHVEIRNYFFSKEEVLEDLDWLLNEERKVWEENYIGNKEPKVELTL